MSYKRLNPSIIKLELESLIASLQPVEPNLASRLSQIKRSIKDYVPAELTSRKILVDFLTELFLDSKLYLTLSLCSDEEKLIVLEDLTDCEKYWYEEAFPKWFSKHDPNFSTWFGKMKLKEYNQADRVLIDQLSDEIENQGGEYYWSFILDLSMATDLVISNTLNQPLCVQLTTISQDFSVAKKNDWQEVLSYWKLKRGLFVSFNPKGNYGSLTKLANFILKKGDDLSSNCYDDCYI